MTAKQEQKINEFCSLLLSKYGFDISPTDPVVPILYIIHDDIKNYEQLNMSIAKQLNETTQRISPQAYNFYSTDAAKSFSIGITLKWIYICITVIIVLLLFKWWWNDYHQLKKAKQIVEKIEPVYIKLFSNMKIDSEGYYYLTFNKPLEKNSIKLLTEYDLDKKGTVKVYLFKK